MNYILIALLLTGCASLPQGLEMTEEDRASCAAHGCTAWTLEELQRLVNMALQKGYLAGKQSL